MQSAMLLCGWVLCCEKMEFLMYGVVISSHWSSAVRYSANQLDITNHGILMRYGFMLPEKQDTQLAYGLAFATGCVSIVKS